MFLGAFRIRNKFLRKLYKKQKGKIVPANRKRIRNIPALFFIYVKDEQRNKLEHRDLGCGRLNRLSLQSDLILVQSAMS